MAYELTVPAQLAATQAGIGLMGIPFRASKSPYVYRNAGILDRLFADKELWHTLCCGDSRTSGIISSKFVGEAPAGIPLGGIVPGSNTLGAASAVTCAALSFGTGDALPTSPYVGSVNDLFTTLEFKTVSGQATNSAINTTYNRLSYTQQSFAAMTTLKSRLTAKAVRARGMIRKSSLAWSSALTSLVAGSPTMPNIYLQHRANGSTGFADAPITSQASSDFTPQRHLVSLSAD